MNRSKARTKAQKEFLRKLRNDPVGLPPDQWPSSVILRRWLRQPGFCAAVNTLRFAMQTRTDLHLAAAAQNAAQALHRSLVPTKREGDGDSAPPTQDLAVLAEQRALIHSLVQLLRLTNARDREHVNVRPTDPRLLEAWRAEKSRQNREMAERCRWRAQDARSAERARQKRLQMSAAKTDKGTPPDAPAPAKANCSSAAARPQ
jgi:hypothetical protein